MNRPYSGDDGRSDLRHDRDKSSMHSGDSEAYLRSMPIYDLASKGECDTALAVIKAMTEGGDHSIENVLLHETDMHGFTLLHYAVARNSLNLVTYLLEKGADIGPDKMGRWPSTIAEMCEVNEAIIDLIADAEAALGEV